MQHKTTKEFELTYPLTRQALRDMKPVTDHLADLLVQGTLYQRVNALNEVYYTVDIDFIRLGGNDIKAVVEGFDGLEEVECYCIEQAAKFFTEETRKQGTMLSAVAEKVKSLVGHDHLYFETPLEIKTSPHTPPVRLFAACVSSIGQVAVMDVDHQWHLVEEKESDAQVIESLYQRVSTMRQRFAAANQKGVAA